MGLGPMNDYRRSYFQFSWVIKWLFLYQAIISFGHRFAALGQTDEDYDAESFQYDPSGIYHLIFLFSQFNDSTITAILKTALGDYDLGVVPGALIECPESPIAPEKSEPSSTYDQEGGHYHFRARAYDPFMGRFLQTDPLGYVDSMNLYQAFNMNPFNFTDPMGESIFDSLKKMFGIVPTEKVLEVANKAQYTDVFNVELAKEAIDTHKEGVLELQKPIPLPQPDPGFFLDDGVEIYAGGFSQGTLFGVTVRVEAALTLQKGRIGLKFNAGAGYTPQTASLSWGQSFGYSTDTNNSDFTGLREIGISRGPIAVSGSVTVKDGKITGKGIDIGQSARVPLKFKPGSIEANQLYMLNILDASIYQIKKD